MLSAADLASCRAALDLTRTDTATRLIYTEVTNESTGVTSPDYAVGDSFSCRVAPQGMQAWTGSGPVGSAATTSVWWLALPQGIELLPADRLQVGDRVFEVVASQSPRTLDLETRVQCLFIQ